MTLKDDYFAGVSTVLICEEEEKEKEEEGKERTP